MGTSSPDPTVSVCIPTYRGADLLSDTIESALVQTMDDIEIIIVDDASPDATADVVKQFDDDRLQYERNDHKLGVAGNWNRAVDLARGRYVKLLCHDDVLHPECLASQVDILESHPDVALVAGKRNIVDEEGRVLVQGRGLSGLVGVVSAAEAIRRTVRSGTNVFGEPVAVLLRRELTTVCGPFSGRRPYMIDLEYWCRMLRFGPLFAQREVVGDFRVTSTSLSVELARQQSGQTIGLLRELREQHAAVVSTTDLALGAVRSAALAAARAVSYRLLHRTLDP